MTKKNIQGFLIVEVLMAIVILSMIFLSIFTTLSFLTNRTEKSKFDTQAASLIQEGVEQTRTILLSHWSQYSQGNFYPALNNTTNNWTLISGDEALLQGRFKRIISISKVCRNTGQSGIQVACTNTITDNVDPQSKIIKVIVSWKEGQSDKSASASLLIFKQK